MARTTIDIDSSVLRELKRLRRSEGKTLGQLVSELVAQALARRKAPAKQQAFKWILKDMGSRIDLRDKEALWKILDEDGPR